MTLNELADDLLEVRRYVRSHPDHVRTQLMKSVAHVHVVKTRFADRFVQIAANIHVGLDRIRCNPEILEGYLYGAAAEIRELAMREELGK